MKEKNTAGALIIVSTVVRVGLVWLLCLFYGKQLVMTLLKRGYLEFLNKLLIGVPFFSLRDCLKVFYKLIWCWTGLAIFIMFIYLACIWIGIKPVFLALVFGFMLMEGTIAMLLSFPRILGYFPEFVLDNVREIHLAYDRIPINLDYGMRIMIPILSIY